MNVNDLIGIVIVLLVALSGFYGLSRLTKPYPSTKEEYEKRLKKGSGIAAGSMNALMYPFEELLHPKAVEAVHVIKDIRQGYYDSQQETGDGSNAMGAVMPQSGSKDVSAASRNRRGRLGHLFRRMVRAFRVGR